MAVSDVQLPRRRQPREIEIKGKPDSVECAYNMVMEIINSDGAAQPQALISKVRRGAQSSRGFRKRVSEAGLKCNKGSGGLGGSMCSRPEVKATLCFSAYPCTR